MIELSLNPKSPAYRVDSIALAKRVCKNLTLEILPFKQTKICGILYRGEHSTSIALNAGRSAGGRNFDCMHELIHYWLHEDEPVFQCIEGNADVFLEWQANEGAAQFLMPYQSFIPNYCAAYDDVFRVYSGAAAEAALVSRLAAGYGVGELAARYRINTLRREIAMYLDGVPVGEIQILRGRR